MSVFNALFTAVSGINAQSTAFTNLSNSIANSQTVGYKADSTAFQDYVAGSLGGAGFAGGVSQSVSAVTVQHLDKQGTASASTSNLSMCVSGNGFFNVSKPSGQVIAGRTQFVQKTYYTRNGEFYTNKDGYLVNTSGYYLDGYMVDSGSANLQKNLTQINVSDVSFRPTQTTLLTMNGAIGKMPASTADSYTPQTYSTTPVRAYSASSHPYQIGLKWQQSSTNPLAWMVSEYAYNTTTGHSVQIGNNSATVTFDSNGLLKTVTDPSGNVTSGDGEKAQLMMAVTYDGIQQNIALDLGRIGGTSGTTMALATGNANQSGVTSVLVDASSQKITMPLNTKIGTTTGSDQSYMTSPEEVGSGSGVYTSAKWVQMLSTPPTWSVQMVNPYMNEVQSGLYKVVFNTDGSVKSSVDAETGSAVSLNSLTAMIGGKSHNVDLGNVSLTTDASLSRDETALKSDSVASGNYVGVEITSDGSVMADFDNGCTQLIAKVVLSNFANVNGLNAVDGQAYTATGLSGNAQTGLVGDNATGSLSVGYVESSTTDLTSNLSQLIVAQEAYSANTKVVTTADDLLQATIAMKR